MRKSNPWNHGDGRERSLEPRELMEAITSTFDMWLMIHAVRWLMYTYVALPERSIFGEWCTGSTGLYMKSHFLLLGLCGWEGEKLRQLLRFEIADGVNSSTQKSGSGEGLLGSGWKRPWRCPHPRAPFKYVGVTACDVMLRSFARNSKAANSVNSLNLWGRSHSQGRNRRLLIAAEDSQGRGEEQK